MSDEDSILNEINQMDIMNLTPLEALNRVLNWQQRLREKGD
jgi:hypothetical protein